jgi:putative copper export protein/mono/diheme cytochrome c family protein
MLQVLLSATRALHYVAMLSLAGTLIFEVCVAGPVLDRLGSGHLPAFRRWSDRLAMASVVLGILSGLLWLLLEASGMSGKPMALVISEGMVSVVLGRTRFGHDWLLRGILAALLLVCLVARRRTSIAALSKTLDLTAIFLGLVEVMTIAGAGHSAGGRGWPGRLQLATDAAHLLAAGAWIGGLLPLALLFAQLGRGGGSAVTSAAYDAASRFSRLGVLAVGTLILTGIVNSIFLVGSVPALLGTEYGHLLMLKLALFLTMVAFAAINRQWLVPQLASVDSTRYDSMIAALGRIRRNALMEAGLGILILVLVGSLGTTSPALHLQPHWPLPFRISVAAFEARPEVRTEALLAGVVMVAGLALLAYGLVRVHQRTLHILLGLFVTVAVGWWPLQFMVVSAYPTTFYHSAAPFTASSIVQGGAIYAENCAGCHGASGLGDGPLATSTPVRPADLTAAHIFEHSEGDLFWWISDGIVAGGMPGFATVLSEKERWDVINFMHARASARQAAAVGFDIKSVSAPLAPDFVFDRGGTEETLEHAREQKSVLLVFYRLPTSSMRIEALARAEGMLETAGLRLLAVAIDRAVARKNSGDEQPDFIIDAAENAAAAYALFAGASAFDHCEFLIDRAGFLRARWCADLPGGVADVIYLAAETERLAVLPVRAAAQTHAHEGPK